MNQRQEPMTEKRSQPAEVTPGPWKVERFHSPSSAGADRTLRGRRGWQTDEGSIGERDADCLRCSARLTRIRGSEGV